MKLAAAPKQKKVVFKETCSQEKISIAKRTENGERVLQDVTLLLTVV